MRAHVRRVKFIIKFFFITSTFLILLSVFILKKTSISELTELETCPACYGVSQCPLLNSGRVHLSPFSSWFNAKNVYFANSPLGNIVLKKLGHNADLAALDRTLCVNIMKNKNENCMVSDIIWRVQDVKSAIFSFLQSQYASTRNSLTFCPAIHADQLDDLIDRIATKSKGVGYKTLLINILTMLVINPEPIILEAFPAIDGWPFPRHLGSCGRLTVQENVGTRVDKLQGSDWHERANVALQLLQSARQLTFQDPRYALYLTDLSLDNVVMDETAKLSIVDLGNIILVDKYPPLTGRLDGWEKMHVSDKVDEDCESCFTFSSEDVCAHKVSDHNYYAVCQFLAQHDWLASPPADIVRSYPQLDSLLHECVNPEMDNGRYIAVRHLIPILANLTNGRR